MAQWLRIRLSMQGTRVRALVREDPTCREATKSVRHSYWACALELACHNDGAQVLQLLKPACLEPNAPQQEKPPQLNVNIMICHMTYVIWVCFMFSNCNHCCFCCGHPFTMLGVSLLSLVKIKYSVCVCVCEKKKKEKPPQWEACTAPWRVAPTHCN